MKGEDFDQLVKRYSEGSTAQQDGDLGEFERGQLSTQLEDAVFKLDKNQFTDVIQTKTGFEILKVRDHYQAGLQPLDKVEGEISNILYRQKMDPAMRDLSRRTARGKLRAREARLHRLGRGRGRHSDSGSRSDAGRSRTRRSKRKSCRCRKPTADEVSLR